MTEDQLKQLATLLMGNNLDTSSNLTFQKGYTNFVDNAQIRVVKDTINYYDKLWKVIQSYLNKQSTLLMDKFSIPELIEFIGVIKKEHNYSNNSLNKYIEMLKMVYRHNFRLDLISYNKIMDFKKLPKNEVETIIVADSVKQTVFDYIETFDRDMLGIRNRLIIYLLYQTGVRLNELLNLDIRNINLDNNSIRLLKTKTKKNRTVFFTDYVKDLLIEYIGLAKPISFLLINSQTLQPAKRSTIYTLINKIKDRCIIPQSISPHKWRHTLATHLVNSNVPIQEVKDVMGHSDLTTTQKYLHTEIKKMKKDVLSVL